MDPLLNLDTHGVDVGGVVLGAQSKSTTLTKVIMSVFLLTSLAVAMRTRPVVPHRLKLALIPGAMLLALACVSASWAKAPVDTLTLAMYQSMLFGTLLISVAVSTDPRRIMQYMLLMFALVIAANLVAVLTRPPAANGHPGIYPFKNMLGGAGGCAFLFGLFHLFQGRLGWRATAWFTMLGAVFVTLASDSKTAMALVFAAPLLAGLFYVTSRALAQGPIVTLMLIVALGVSGFHVIGGMMAFDFDDFLIATYGGKSFTGRTDIWALMYEHMPLSPWFGNGYRGFWSVGAASPKTRLGNRVHPHDRKRPQWLSRYHAGSGKSRSLPSCTVHGAQLPNDRKVRPSPNVQITVLSGHLHLLGRQEFDGNRDPVVYAFR